MEDPKILNNTDGLKSAQINISFKEIENLGVLKRFAKHLYTLLGLTFDFVDIGGKHSPTLKAVKRYTPFCQLIKNSPMGSKSCEQCDIKALECSIQSRQPIIYRCHLGLLEILVPLILHGEILGFLTSGQILTSRPTEKNFKKIEGRLKELGINSTIAKKHYFAIPVITKEKTNSIADLISIIAEYVAEAENKIIELQKHSQRNKIHDAREFIKLHYRENISLQDVASAVHISPSRFAHLFKERLGITFTSYVNELRINEAQNLLSNTNFKIIDVAFKSGFRNLSHFNHIFKAKTGFSPTKYKERQLDE